MYGSSRTIMNEVKKKVTAVVLTTAIGVTSVSALADFDKETSNTDVNDTNITEVTTTPEAVNEPTASPTIEPTASPTEDVAEETSNDLDILPTTTFEPKETEVPLRETNKNSSDVSLKNAFEDIIENDTLTKYNDEIATFASSTVVDSGKCGDNLTWTLYEDGLLSITGTGAMTDYSYISGSRPWDAYKDKVTLLSLKDGITHVGNFAFYGYSGFTGDLTIPDSVTSIGGYAFQNCKGFTGALTIPDSVTSIGGYAFQNCSGFTGALTIPDSVTSIRGYAFQNCSGFTGSLTIPDGVTSIEDYVFDGCKGFTGSLTIPDGVTSIQSDAFAHCSNFTGSLTIPNSVTSIGDSVFAGCSGFTGSLTIPNSVTSIGIGAFDGCKGFTGTLTIPDTVTSIGNYAFESCSGFTGSLTIPNSVTSIRIGVFDGCKGFTGSLTIPDGVTSIGYSAFDGCSGFTGDLVIPNSVTSIGDRAFCQCYGFTGSLTIPNSVTSIGDSVFAGCSGFTGTLTIPDTVTSIGNYAFENCSGFTGSLTIPNSVTTIKYGAFLNCSGFTGTFTIPDSVTSIGNIAFGGCGNITDMYLNKEENSISTGNFPNKIHWAYDLSKCSTQLSKDTFQYTGKPIKLGTDDLAVLSPKGKTLYEGTDYVLTYSNNTNLGTATAKISPPTDGISVNQNSVAFSIEEGDISNATISSIANEKYNGNAHTPNFTVTLNDTVLTKDVDYTVTYTNNTDVGTATVKITGKGNYAGTNSTTFKITAESISNTSVNTIPEQKYMGVAITPIPTITYNGKTLSNNVDYTLSYSNNNRVGTATVTITGKGNFTGTTSKNFTIKDFTPDSSNPISLNSDKLKINWDNTSYVYDGNEKKPKPTSIRYYFNDVYSYSLIEGQDFSLSYANNTDAGTGTVTVNGVGGFSNSKSNNFTITSASINNAVFTDIETAEFSGGKLYPNFTVTVDGRELVKNTDYTVEYSNNVQVGTGNIKITGKDNYTGVAETTFTVNPYDPYDNRDPIDMSTLHPTITGTFTYNKAEQKPVPTIVYQKYNNETSTMLEYTLVEGKDYNLTYTNNINAGTATLTATGIGVFKGSKNVEFTINPKSAESLSIDTIGDKVFSGVAQTPDAIIKDID